jgi:hypothetical protein
MSVGVQIVFDAADPETLSGFWAALLGYVFPPPPDGYASWEAFLAELGVPKSDWNRASAIVDPDGKGPRIYFQRVPEGKTVKNRVHLDVNVTRGPTDSIERRRETVEAEVQKAEDLGARFLYRVEEMGGYHVTMADPEGNEFCLH